MEVDMRLIDADTLIEDLQYDVDLDARALDSSDVVGDREAIQFDKDCKQNCIDLLRNAPTVDPVEAFKSYALKDKCNRICVWSDDGKRYKRFDFVAWENGDEEG